MVISILLSFMHLRCKIEIEMVLLKGSNNQWLESEYESASHSVEFYLDHVSSNGMCDVKSIWK